MSTPGSDPATPPVMVRYAVSTRSVRVGDVRGRAAAVPVGYLDRVSGGRDGAVVGDVVTELSPRVPDLRVVDPRGQARGEPTNVDVVVQPQAPTQVVGRARQTSQLDDPALQAI